MNKTRACRIIKRPIVSEKGLAGIQKCNQYPFEVEVRANKVEIGKAVEVLFENVKVVKVRTANRPGKPKGARFRPGRTPDTKKAVVTLREGDKIDFI